MFCIIQVVDDDYLDDWKDLADHIALTLAKRDKHGAYPQVVFGVTSLCLPNTKKPHSVKNAIYRRIQGYGFNNDAYAVASDPIPVDPFADEDEGEE
jgi:hypothetical protein